MKRNDATPIFLGVTAAAIAFTINVAIVAVPVLVAHGFNTLTQASTLDAVIVSLCLVVLGHGGAMSFERVGIDGTAVLPPLGLTFLFALVCGAAMLRTGRSMTLTEPSGALKRGALTALGLILGGFGISYALMATVASLLARTPGVQPVTVSAGVSALVLSVIAGAAGLMASLVRRSSEDAPRVGLLALVPDQYAAALRAIGVLVLGVFGGAAVALTVWMVVRHDAIFALHRALEPDLFGTIVLVLAGLVFFPTMVVWAAAFVCAGSVTVGSNTHISFEGSLTGVLPAFPILGALPEPGHFSPWVWALIAIPALASIGAAIFLAFRTRDFDGRGKVASWLTYAIGALIVLMLGFMLASGSIGTAQLAHVGPQLPSLILPVALLVLVPAALIAGWSQTGLDAWVFAKLRAGRSRVLDRTAALRARVEDAEAKVAASDDGGEEVECEEGDAAAIEESEIEKDDDPEDPADVSDPDEDSAHSRSGEREREKEAAPVRESD
ncbi:DUF6350 family protein [Dermabacter sp. p3-SID358]|uniref:cell division protein PerM n=1 Tax=Dermabacter sp. p3-SID358 TaxID=2916114 RepID=UPI0021A44C94|nr:DUF6350 family protein [Dermabacter sp. p3-SID358]MCT1867226.1 DUF6350 family protein [Dermabacter sp. p3-SID358]